MTRATLREPRQRAGTEYIGGKWQSFKSYFSVYLITDALLANVRVDKYSMNDAADAHRRVGAFKCLRPFTVCKWSASHPFLPGVKTQAHMRTQKAHTSPSHCDVHSLANARVLSLTSCLLPLEWKAKCHTRTHSRLSPEPTSLPPFDVTNLLLLILYSFSPSLCHWRMCVCVCVVQHGGAWCGGPPGCPLWRAGIKTKER